MVYNDLKVVDRFEMESYNSIRRLIENYVSRNFDRPMSFAVFGEPGSGKSFGIKQLVTTLRTPNNEFDLIEFNLSQFSDSKELIDAFHVVRDRAFQGKIPLVIFDEIDCRTNKEDLYWLRHFLVPMHDGRFRAAHVEHPIGQSIFVFVGGTHSTFASFAREDKTQSNGDYAHGGQRKDLTL